MKKKILIVVSDYYKEIASGLVLGAESYLSQGHSKSKVEKNLYKSTIIEYKIINAPGSFEIPFLINKYKKSYDGFLALGCIIRGETYHFEVISNEVARKLMDLSVDIKKPIGFGILTCENIKQALQRSKAGINNKGKEAAKACLDILLYG